MYFLPQVYRVWRHLLVWTLLIIFAAPRIASTEPLSISDAAKAFGSLPTVWGMNLSPDGHRVSFLVRHSSGVPVAMVLELGKGPAKVVLASDKKQNMDIRWCDWANDSRLLCGFWGIHKYRHWFVTATRLVAVNDDGSNQQVLAQRQQREFWFGHQDEIVDWLPDDREHILMELAKERGEGVSIVNIYTNKTKVVESARDSVYDWASDGRGNLKLRREIISNKDRIRYRAKSGDAWNTLHIFDPEDHMELFVPIGFGEDPNDLLVWDRHEGRDSVFSIDLTSAPSTDNQNKKLVYSHAEVDLDRVVRIGKRNRTIGVSYTTDRSRIRYFDESIKKVDASVRSVLPEMQVTFIAESWDRRFYLILVSSDIESGTYYRFDTSANQLQRITPVFSSLKDVDLNSMTPIKYPSDDGVMVPSYLSRPAGAPPGPLPLIVLPHGGPYSRDEWGYDFLAQFLSARGYLVIQSNYRGSSGYGKEWAGEGAFRGWKRAMIDIDHGVRHLIEEGIADKDRICALGWSYGGYAALMSAIEYPDRYRCVVSIAGVSDPVMLVNDTWGLGRKYRKSQISIDPDDVAEGSPRRRAGEIQVPVLLFHGDQDLNVDIEHSEKMEKALKKKKKDVEFIEYEGVEHSIEREEYRIDMFERIGAFLEENLAPRESTS